MASLKMSKGSVSKFSFIHWAFIEACCVPGTGLEAGEISEIRYDFSPLGSWSLVHELSFLPSVFLGSVPPSFCILGDSLPFTLRCAILPLLAMISDVHWRKNGCMFQLPCLHSKHPPTWYIHSLSTAYRNPSYASVTTTKATSSM